MEDEVGGQGGREGIEKRHGMGGGSIDPHHHHHHHHHLLLS